MVSKVIITLERQHFQRIEHYTKKIRQVYLQTIREVAAIAPSIKFDDTRPFSFDDYPKSKAQIDALIGNMSRKMEVSIQEMSRYEWIEACYKNDILVNHFAKRVKIPTYQLSLYKNRNLEALKAFQERKIKGLNLSDRVWRYSHQFKGELELALDIGLAEGRSAAQLSRDIRSYLQDPDKLYRRVRDKHGNLQLSKNAERYHPAPGAYRSSYKNAMRLTRTEINAAYRSSDHEKFNQLDFVVGFEVRRSNHNFDCKVCEALKGKYPKSFLFTGWHPHCRCHVVAITATQEEFIEHEQKLLRGEHSTLKSKNTIDTVPNNYTEWLKEKTKN